MCEPLSSNSSRKERGREEGKEIETETATERQRDRQQGRRGNLTKSIKNNYYNNFFVKISQTEESIPVIEGNQVQVGNELCKMKGCMCWNNVHSKKQD